jgi:hypothetical protein
LPAATRNETIKEKLAAATRLKNRSIGGTVLTASCIALTNSGVSTEVSPPDVARAATTPLETLLEPDEEIKKT